MLSKKNETYLKYPILCISKLIVHQDNAEHLLASIFTEQKPEVVGNDYLVIGTLARPAWKRETQQQLNPQGMFEVLHDFKEVVTFKLVGSWSEQKVDLQAQKRDIFYE